MRSNAEYRQAGLLKARNEELIGAAQAFEQCAQSQLAFNLRRFNVHDALFRGLLCLVAEGDVETAQGKLLQFGTWRVSDKLEYALMTACADRIHSRTLRFYLSSVCAEAVYSRFIVFVRQRQR